MGETGRERTARHAWRVDERSWREAAAIPGEAGTIADDIALITARAREAGIDDETVDARKSKHRTKVRNQRETDYPA